MGLGNEQKPRETAAFADEKLSVVPYRSPLKLLIVVSISIFVNEAFLMLVLSLLPQLPPAAVILFDSLLLTVLVFPTLYLFVFRPIIVNIHERKRAEDELRVLNEFLEKRVAERTRELEESNRLKDLFTDIMRHDLLNPTGVIRNYAEMQLEASGNNEQKKIAIVIKNNADRVILMIEDASTYAKLESIEMLERERLELKEVFRSVADNFSSEIGKRKIRLDYLPKGEFYAMANPMLENVFSNLLSNAIKFSPDGSKVEVNITDESDRIRIYVKDWGCGIEDADKPKLFTRFHRIDKIGVKGTGLGLAIVKRIVDLHNGRVWVEDNPEGGSIFNVEIPKA